MLTYTGSEYYYKEILTCPSLQQCCRVYYFNLTLLPDYVFQFNSVQFSRSVMSDSLWPYESQHARPSCPSPTPGVHSNSRPLSQWCHPAISSSVVPFSSCPQSVPASESFSMSQLFPWGGLCIYPHSNAKSVAMVLIFWPYVLF